ncbi:MAG: GNAT family N-acetyltransferase [Aciduliprofundum sp.]|nr:MAG: GNAT family N-acetyltransferase [Aciduliprofundum sp.]
MMGIKIRKMEEKDIKETAELLIRLKKFNAEHDPLFTITDDIERNVNDYLKQSISSEDRVVLIAEDNGKIVGAILGEIRDRLFYEPRREIRVRDIYILPHYRKKGLGKLLLEELEKRVKGKGVDIITVEFPNENLLAHKFYSALGMRSLICVYGKSLR